MSLKDKFSALKKKFPKGSVFGKKPEKPKEDLLGGMVATGPALDRMAKDAGRTEYGRTGEEKKSFFGKMKGKYSDWSKKRSEAARQKKYFTVKKCPKCGQKHTDAEPCPVTGKTEPQPKSEKEEKRIGLQTTGIGKKIGGIVASGVMMAAAAGGAFLYFPEFAQLVLIVGAIAMALIIISMFVKGIGGYLFLGFIVISGLALWQFGFLTPIIEEYAPPVADLSGTLWEAGEDVWYNTQCIIKGGDIGACMKAREEEEEESIKKLGPYETVELKWGRRLNGDYDYDLPESGLDYTLDVSFINKNKEVYEINFTEGEVNAHTTIDDVDYSAGTKSAFEKYTLAPEEELPIRFKFSFPSDWECIGSQAFKVNATTEQKSGGWSDFGIAPSDEDQYRKFIHGFNPNINAEPGPLNIYVFTDPWGIDASEFIGVPDEDKLEVIIKIQNKVKSGTAEIEDLYLIQEFELPPPKLFDIKQDRIPIVCEGNKGLRQNQNFTLSVASEYCSETSGNCLKFHFDPILKINPNEKITISCIADVQYASSYEYTDQIRVFANFEYTQEWTKPIPCAT
jgi:hypothetical protein